MDAEPEDADHANEGNANTSDTKVREEGVGIEPADGHGWDSQQENVEPCINLECSFMLYNLSNLFAYEKEVADTDAQLHNPDANIDNDLSFLAENFKTEL